MKIILLRRGYPELSCQGELRCDLSLVTGLQTRPAPWRDIPPPCLCAGLKPGNRLKRVFASCHLVKVCDLVLLIFELKLASVIGRSLVGLRVGATH